MNQYQHLCRIAGKTWGINKNIRRLLYKTVIERTLCHGAAAWGHNMTSRFQKKLGSIQRLFLLYITGAYRTTPTAALQVATVLQPPHLQTTYVRLLEQDLRPTFFMSIHSGHSRAAPSKSQTQQLQAFRSPTCIYFYARLHRFPLERENRPLPPCGKVYLHRSHFSIHGPAVQMVHLKEVEIPTFRPSNLLFNFHRFFALTAGFGMEQPNLRREERSRMSSLTGKMEKNKGIKNTI
ncbi:hypothetical protein AVEN_49611-1 [Araneus ventricosus]|uniref:Reverse transcriptase domain-containing protein n=1 Tax=Araneus ventricosus TaxID=182803 RepID=A0A4Y2SG21_ARAVE|nr:hypothetical protein AVEN_49611-1 [Araneus ventricosus]